MSSRDYDRGYAARPSGQSTSGRNASRRARRNDSVRSAAGHYEYWYGTEAPDLEYWEEEEPIRAPRQQSRQRQQSRKAEKRRTFMNPAMIAFLAGVMCLMSFFLIEYISLQSEVKGIVGEIAQLETQLASLKSDNDETLNEINSGINLDDIKYRAIAQLGMTYAQEDQIVTYDGGSGDYVRQVSELKK